MNITGLEGLVFGVEDMAEAVTFLEDYGLDKVSESDEEVVFEALDGGEMVLRASDDPSLPKPNAPSPNLRETIYGVADEATLDAIEAELSKDREVTRGEDGRLRSYDDDGFALAFQMTRKRAIEAPHIGINVPGQAPQRAYNEQGVEPDAPIYLRKLSHVVVFVADLDAAERFYNERLGFRTTDRFTGAGVFLRPQGEDDHHSLFLLKRFFEGLSGLEHFAFHVGSGSEVLQAGHRFHDKGYQTFWGPGRHLMGSNFFWYFKSPFGGNIEYDADMDIHDDHWEAREAEFTSVSAQSFLFEARKFWSPADG